MPPFEARGAPREPGHISRRAKASSGVASYAPEPEAVMSGAPLPLWVERPLDARYKDANATVVCPHRAPVLYSRERGFAVKATCGSRAACYPSRVAWRRKTRKRLEGVSYVRTPDLWTVTARTKEHDAERLAAKFIRARRRRGEVIHPSVAVEASAAPESFVALFMREAQDWGDPSNREHVKALGRGLSRLLRAIRRQFARQQEPGYRESRWALVLKRKWGTAYPVRGRLGADWRVNVKEAGEQNGRLHAHAASDFDFIHHGWLREVARRCGLGFVQYSRKESAGLRKAARGLHGEVRARTIGGYLAKYLGKGDAPDKPWLWPRHTRLLNAARGVLPVLERAKDIAIDWVRSVPEVAVDFLGAAWCDANAACFSVKAVLAGQLVPEASCAPSMALR